MIPDNKKKIATLIVSKFKPDGSATEDTPMKDEEEIDADSEALKACAEDMMIAIKSGSAHDLMQALKAFLETHEQHEESESPEEEAAEHKE